VISPGFQKPKGNILERTNPLWKSGLKQAAIGGIPLGLGLASGEVILAIAVMSILFTAPLGAIGMQKTAHLLLAKEVDSAETQMG